MATGEDREDEQQQTGGNLEQRDSEQRDSEQRNSEQRELAAPDEGYRGSPGVSLLEERDRQRQRLGGELRELDREIEGSEGFRIFGRMSLLGKSYFVFDGNYLNLKHVLEEFEQPTVFMRLWEERRGGRFDLFINDVVRLFHNYLAGSATLLEHIDALQEEIYEDSSQEYAGQRERRIENSPLPRFVRDLLAYTLREGLPLSLAELSLGRAGSGVQVTSAVCLDAGRLATWEHWSEEGRRYLDALGGKIKLSDVVGEHKEVIADFYRWFAARQSEVHQRSLEELDDLWDKREALRQEIERLEDFLEAAERTAVTVREDREKLSRELEAEKESRAEEQARANRLEADLENERSRGGFWRRGR